MYTFTLAKEGAAVAIFFLLDEPTTGLHGDGKEVAQLALAKYFQSGDWRAGYYRDQTFMFATLSAPY